MGDEVWIGVKGATEVGFEREWDSALDCYVATLYPILDTKPKIQSEFICQVEDCPHCAYEHQQEYEAELEEDAAIDFGEWLMGQGIEYIDNTDEGNVYMVESNMNRKMTMKELYKLYLKSE